MGRVKKYTDGKKQRARKSSAKSEKKGGNDSDGSDRAMESKGTDKTDLSKAKRKQIFKKSKEGRREHKKQILELKRQSSKLKKRNLDQKSIKKRLTKEI